MALFFLCLETKKVQERKRGAELFLIASRAIPLAQANSFYHLVPCVFPTTAEVS